jgi:hypothetical protein
MKMLFQRISIWKIDDSAGRQLLGDLNDPWYSPREVIRSEIIFVTRNKARYWLFQGWRPYIACIHLGLEECPVIVLEVEDLREELAQIDQILRDLKLPALECAEQVIRRQQILDALPPWARPGNGPGRGRGKRARKEISAPASSAGLGKTHSLPAIPKAELITTDRCCRWCGGTQFVCISQGSIRLYCGCHSANFLGYHR